MGTNDNIQNDSENKNTKNSTGKDIEFELPNLVGAVMVML